MFLRFLRLLGLWTATEPVEAAGAPGEAPPAAPDGGGGAPAPTEDQQLEQMQAGLESRLLGDEPPETLVPDGAAYKDVKPLRDEIAAAREKYAPAAEALARIPEALRETVLTFAPAIALTATDPTIAADVAYLQSVYPGLDPSDQQLIAGAFGAVDTDPAGVADFVRQARGLLEDDGTADETTASTTDVFGFEPDDPNRPLTAAELDARLAEHDQQVEFQAEQTRQVAAITAEAKELGYDPASTDPIEQARFETLLGVARRTPDGDLHKAHELLEARDQQIIDQYASGKRGHVRPQPPGGGAPASGERVLESLDDSQAAMIERLRATGYKL